MKGDILLKINSYETPEMKNAETFWCNDELFSVVEDKKDGNFEKYGFTGQTVYVKGRTLHRIVSTRDIYNNHIKIPKGKLGGWIEKEENLNQYDNAWIGENVFVFGNSKVCDDAYVNSYSGDIFISGNSIIEKNVQIYGKSIIEGNSRITDNAMITQNRESDCVHIIESLIGGNSIIGGSAKITLSTITGMATVKYSHIKTSYIDDISKITGCIYNSTIHGATVWGTNSLVSDTIISERNAVIGYDAMIKGTSDYIYISYFKNSAFDTGYPITFYKNYKGNICVSYHNFCDVVSELKYYLKFKDQLETNQYVKLINFVSHYFSLKSWRKEEEKL